MDRLAADRMFAAVVEHGSFAGAAQRLGASSGQASKLVSRLEAELGVRLLHRTTRALSLTEAGRAYHDRLRPLLDEWDAMDAEARDRGGSLRGTIRLTAPLGFGTQCLSALFARFALGHPGVGLEVELTDRLVSLVEEGFDLAVRIGRPADSSLVARKLGEARVVAVAAPGYLDGRGVPERPSDLLRHDCLIDTNRREPLRWQFRDESVAVAGRLRFNSPALCLAAAEAGLGVACMPQFIAAGSLAAGRVVEVLPDQVPDPLGIFAMTPSGRHLAARVCALIEALAVGLRGTI